MTDKSSSNDQRQGEAPTRQMPRVSKDEQSTSSASAEAGTTGSGKTSGEASARPDAAKPADKDTATSAEATAAKKPGDDAPAKPNSAPAAKKPAAASGSAADGTKQPSISARQPLSRPSAGAQPGAAPRRPLSGLSKDEYSRTTKPSPDTTAVIPAVTDAEPPTPQSKAGATKRSAAAAESTTAGSATAAETSVPRHLRRVRYVEPWSVTRLAFVVSVALMVVGVVAVAVFWLVLQITGVWSALNDSVSNILSDDASGFDITEYFGFGRLVGLTLVLSAINVVFMTALATIAAHLYNIAAQILGGVRISIGDENR